MEIDYSMNLCDYGCGQKGTHYFKTVDKWCCSKHHSQCPARKKELSERFKGKNNPLYGINRKGENNPMWGKKQSDEAKRKIGIVNTGRVVSDITRQKISKIGKGRICSNETKEKIRNTQKGKFWEELFGKEKADKMKSKKSSERKGKSWNQIYGKRRAKKIREKIILTISKIKKKYSFFAQIEEMRYNPDKPGEKEIQVHCKNHNCPNSKEQGGWFTPTNVEISERVRQLEKDYGNGGGYFYCCEECKNECPLYNLRKDPFQNTEKKYTQGEYNQFRQYVLERDNYICQYCGESAEHVHHERPQKIEPFFSLDPDYAWSCCKKCHYEKGHKDECSTGKLANILCI